MTAWNVPACARVTALVGDRLGLNGAMRRPEEAEARIRRAMARAHVDEPACYLALLEHQQIPLDDLICEFTVRESYFFRHPEQFDLVRREILPDLRRSRGPAHALRIWSAGCAGGEEPYSLAIVLHDEEVPGSIVATDVSPDALRFAARAEYRRWALRGVPEEMVRRGFRQAQNRWTLRDGYRQHVHFAAHNLLESPCSPATPALAAMDLILCRNVLIYLDAPSIVRVTHALAGRLAPGGWLLASPSDPLLDDPRLSLVQTASGVVYQRRDARKSAATHGTTAPRVDLRSPSIDDGRPPAAGVPRRAGVQPDTRPAAAARGVRHAAPAAARPDTLMALSHRIGGDPMSAALHLRHATLLMDIGCEREAIDALRRVLYLDRSLAIAHYLLGTLLARAGRAAEARRAFRHARDCALGVPAAAPLPLADGASAGRVAAAAAAELARLERSAR